MNLRVLLDMLTYLAQSGAWALLFLNTSQVILVGGQGWEPLDSAVWRDSSKVARSVINSLWSLSLGSLFVKLRVGEWYDNWSLFWLEDNGLWTLSLSACIVPLGSCSSDGRWSRRCHFFLMVLRFQEICFPTPVPPQISIVPPSLARP